MTRNRALAEERQALNAYMSVSDADAAEAWTAYLKAVANREAVEGTYPPHAFQLQEDWKEIYGVPCCSECSREEWDVVHSFPSEAARSPDAVPA